MRRHGEDFLSLWHALNSHLGRVLDHQQHPTPPSHFRQNRNQKKIVHHEEREGDEEEYFFPRPHAPAQKRASLSQSPGKGLKSLVSNHGQGAAAPCLKPVGKGLLPLVLNPWARGCCPLSQAERTRGFSPLPHPLCVLWATIRQNFVF